MLTTVACSSPSTKSKTIYQQHDSPLQGRCQEFESARLHRITARLSVAVLPRKQHRVQRSAVMRGVGRSAGSIVGDFNQAAGSHGRHVQASSTVPIDLRTRRKSVGRGRPSRCDSQFYGRITSEAS